MLDDIIMFNDSYFDLSIEIKKPNFAIIVNSGITIIPKEENHDNNSSKSLEPEYINIDGTDNSDDGETLYYIDESIYGKLPNFFNIYGILNNIGINISNGLQCVISFKVEKFILLKPSEAIQRRGFNSSLKQIGENRYEVGKILICFGTDYLINLYYQNTTEKLDIYEINKRSKGLAKNLNNVFFLYNSYEFEILPSNKERHILIISVVKNLEKINSNNYLPMNVSDYLSSSFYLLDDKSEHIFCYKLYHLYKNCDEKYLLGIDISIYNTFKNALKNYYDSYDKKLVKDGYYNIDFLQVKNKNDQENTEYVLVENYVIYPYNLSTKNYKVKVLNFNKEQKMYYPNDTWFLMFYFVKISNQE